MQENQDIKTDTRNNAYYPLSHGESIFGSQDESFVPWNVYLTLQSSIQFADYKINLLFVIAGIILTIVIDDSSDLAHEPLMYKITFILFMLVMIPFIYYCVRTVAAHVTSKPDVPTKKLYFFGDIASMPTSEYIRRFRAYNRAEHYDELLLQIHNLSHIAKLKFYNYGKALYLLCVLMILLVIMLVIQTTA